MFCAAASCINSGRQYSCKACCFTTPALLDFLIHVQKIHFDRHASKHEITLSAPLNVEPAQSNVGESTVSNDVLVSPSQKSTTTSCAGMLAVKKEFVPAEEINKFSDKYIDNTAKNQLRQEQLCSAEGENDKASAGTRSSRCSRGKTINQIINTLKEEYSAGISNSGSIFQQGNTPKISQSDPKNFMPAGNVSESRNILGSGSFDGCLDSGPFQSRKMNTTQDHYVSIQSLLSSGLVTMPQAGILRSITCDPVTWKSIQARLHSSFCEFPYLTKDETVILSRVTGLTVLQIKTLFVVARLQHSISWGEDEITAARNYLNISANRFLMT